jgi:hypothetical protein
MILTGFDPFLLMYGEFFSLFELICCSCSGVDRWLLSDILQERAIIIFFLMEGI